MKQDLNKTISYIPLLHPLRTDSAAQFIRDYSGTLVLRWDNCELFFLSKIMLGPMGEAKQFTPKKQSAPKFYSLVDPRHTFRNQVNFSNNMLLTNS